MSENIRFTKLSGSGNDFALTRARRKLIVVGDSATIGTHLFYQQLIDYFETIGAYRTVWEEPDLLS